MLGRQRAHDFPEEYSFERVRWLATELHLSVKTIETYQAHIKEKLGLNNAAELSDKASRWMLDSMRRNLQLKRLLKTAD